MEFFQLLHQLTSHFRTFPNWSTTENRLATLTNLGETPLDEVVPRESHATRDSRPCMKHKIGQTLLCIVRQVAHQELSPTSKAHHGLHRDHSHPIADVIQLLIVPALRKAVSGSHERFGCPPTEAQKIPFVTFLVQLVGVLTLRALPEMKLLAELLSWAAARCSVQALLARFAVLSHMVLRNAVRSMLDEPGHCWMWSSNDYAQPPLKICTKHSHMVSKSLHCPLCCTVASAVAECAILGDGWILPPPSISSAQ